jgi:peptidyl-prolyl cis-trans isomerase B (cyclophilin B)
MKHNYLVTVILAWACIIMVHAQGTYYSIEEITSETDSVAEIINSNRPRVRLHTTHGDICLELYNETPLHRDNFLRLVESGFYEGTLFHRVIRDFMIQGGDPNSRNATPDQELGDEDDDCTIEAEIRYPQIFHKRGVLAAAREGDLYNPERRSSCHQFYIVCGHRFDDYQLDYTQTRLDQDTNGAVKLTPEVRDVYKKVGGTPHLDGQYTVFGEVTEGMDIVLAISYLETNPDDRPFRDVRILKATVEQR